MAEMHEAQRSTCPEATQISLSGFYLIGATVTMIGIAMVFVLNLATPLSFVRELRKRGAIGLCPYWQHGQYCLAYPGVDQGTGLRYLGQPGIGRTVGGFLPHGKAIAPSGQGILQANHRLPHPRLSHISRNWLNKRRKLH